MKVALIVSVVAQVAVSQPFPFFYPQQPYNPCAQLGRDYACCQPARMDPWGRVIEPGCNVPQTPWGIPPEYRGKLEATCCPPARQCCIQDTRNWQFPTYTCCETGQKCDLPLGGTGGVCSTVAVGNGSAPIPVPGTGLDTYGRCPQDGALALTMGNGPFKCSLDPAFIMAACPSGSNCVKDLTAVVSSGVCCALSGCQNYTTCPTCVMNPTRFNAPCSWLSQGDLDNPSPRCVAGCANFPDKSCIEPGNSRACPKSTANPNGTIYNTGTCQRRCGLVGTGRSSRINNNGNMYACMGTNITATVCCNDFPGDYCCGACSGLAPHCSSGQVPGGPLCGVPVRGTPNNFFNTQGSVNQYVPQPFNQPVPYFNNNFNNNNNYNNFNNNFNPYFQQQQFPFFPQNYGQPMYGPQNYGWGSPQMFFGWRNSKEGADEVEGKSLASDYSDYVVPEPKNGGRQMAPYIPPPAVDQLPSAWICSCDGGCMALEDCCEDIVSFCYVNGTMAGGYGR